MSGEQAALVAILAASFGMAVVLATLLIKVSEKFLWRSKEPTSFLSKLIHLFVFYGEIVLLMVIAVPTVQRFDFRLGGDLAALMSSILALTGTLGGVYYCWKYILGDLSQYKSKRKPR